MAEDKESEKAFERYENIVNFLKSKQDKKGLDLVQELIDKCINYIKITVEMQNFLKIHEARDIDIYKYQRQLENIDQRKRIIHNALISQLVIVNRYLFKNYTAGSDIEFGGIFSKNPSTIRNRYAVGEWAKDLTDALYARGIIKVKLI